ASLATGTSPEFESAHGLRRGRPGGPGPPFANAVTSPVRADTAHLARAPAGCACRATRTDITKYTEFREDCRDCQFFALEAGSACRGAQGGLALQVLPRAAPPHLCRPRHVAPVPDPHHPRAVERHGAL